MATFTSMACVIPEHDGTYSVAILRGVMASGGSDRGAELIHVEMVNGNLSLANANELARGMQHHPDFWRYWDRETQALVE